MSPGAAGAVFAFVGVKVAPGGRNIPNCWLLQKYTTLPNLRTQTCMSAQTCDIRTKSAKPLCWLSHFLCALWKSEISLPYSPHSSCVTNLLAGWVKDASFMHNTPYICIRRWTICNFHFCPQRSFSQIEWSCILSPGGATLGNQQGSQGIANATKTALFHC